MEAFQATFLGSEYAHTQRGETMNRIRTRSAFTLIELLIVVAIIAILAAIAVPNFLEAQTRSKVSRVKTDLRSIAVAEEDYFVDWNSYTFGQGGTQYPIVWEGFRLLTTPVAFITSIPLDPFDLTRFDGDLRLNTFELGVGRAGVGPAGRSFTDSDNVRGMPSDTYELESDGPDHDDDTRGDWATGNYPTWNRTNVIQVLALIYDPRNGTVSVGEIFRTGGTVPPGPALSLFYTLGQK